MTAFGELDLLPFDSQAYSDALVGHSFASRSKHIEAVADHRMRLKACLEMLTSYYSGTCLLTFDGLAGVAREAAQNLHSLVAERALRYRSAFVGSSSIRGYYSRIVESGFADVPGYC